MAKRRRRSGAPIAVKDRAGLPDPKRSIQLVDKRILVCSGALPETPEAGPGAILGGSYWAGPRGLQIIVTLDHTEAWGPLLHVSVAYAKLSRWPDWADIVAVKAAFFGDDTDACMLLPAHDDWINVRTNAFHLWQTPQVWGIR